MLLTARGCFQAGAVSSQRLFPSRGCFQRGALSSAEFFLPRALALASQGLCPGESGFQSRACFQPEACQNCSGHFPTVGLFQPKVVSSRGRFPAQSRFQGWALHPQRAKQLSGNSCSGFFTKTTPLFDSFRVLFDSFACQTSSSCLSASWQHEHAAFVFADTDCSFVTEVAGSFLLNTQLSVEPRHSQLHF